jgi:hypothetical protein
MEEYRCVFCPNPATRAICHPAEPWWPVCDTHDNLNAMGNVPIADYERVNSYMPKLFGGTYEVSRPDPHPKDGE